MGKKERLEFKCKKMHNLFTNRIGRKYSNPWDIFHEKLYTIKKIIDFLNQNIKDTKLIHEIYKQQIISLTTLLEVFLRESFIFFSKKDKLKISLDKYSNIKNDAYTLEEIFILYEKIKKK